MRFVDCNDATFDVFRCKREDIIGESPEKIFPEFQPDGGNSRELATELIKTALDGHPQLFEWEHVRLDGTHFIGEVMLAKIEIGNEIFLQGMVRDRSSERKIHEENEKLAMLANSTTNMVVIADHEGKIEWVNSAFTRITGYELKEVQGQKPGDILQGKDSDPQTVNFMSGKVQAGQGFKDVEIINYSKDGRAYWVSIEVNPILDANGEVVKFIAIESDITEKKYAQIALSESEERFRALINQSPVGVIEWDLDFRVREWNEASERIFGYKREEVLGKHAEFLLTDEVKPLVDEVWQSLISLKGGERSTNMNVTREGNLITCDWYNSTILSNDKQITGVVSMVEDISEKLKSEEILKESEIKFRQIVHSSPMGIFMYELREDDDLYLIETNESANEILGVDCRKLIGLKITDAFPGLAGTPLPDHFKKTARAGIPWETRDVQYDEGEIKGIYEVNTFQAGLNRMVVMFLDVTDRIKAEEAIKKKNEELLKINQELDRFVYSASHDLRAPIASLLGSIQVLRKETERENIMDLLGMQEKSLNRLDDFIRDIVNYSRNTRLEIEETKINMSNEIKESFEQLQFMDNFDKIERKINVDQKSDFISDPRRLKVVLNNLISNGIKYSDLSKPNPFIEVNVEVDKDSALIRISDNGIGIDPVQKDSIFEMFFRASERSSGSGLGLYIVKEVIQRLKGEIKVDTKLLEGTTFTVTIPNLINKKFSE